MSYILPEHLKALYIHEEELREAALSLISADSKLKQHINLIEDSLNIIFEAAMSYAEANSDELALQTLGIRLFNDISSSLKMLLSGYFQIAFSIQRDMVETGFLLDYFSTDVSKISEWKSCSNAERIVKFGPGKIRNALDQRDNHKEKSKRTEIYKTFCEYASHASYPGTKIIAKEGFVQMGPFFDEKMVSNCLFELTKQTLMATVYYIKLIKFDSIELKTLQLKYYELSQSWLSENMRHL